MPTYPKRPQAYVSFQVRLPPDLKRQLENYAFETEQSQLAVVTAALEDFLLHAGQKNDMEVDRSDKDSDVQL